MLPPAEPLPCPPSICIDPPVLAQPAAIDIEPACELVLDALPAVRWTLPPTPLLPTPAHTFTEPPPPAAPTAPDDSSTRPLAPSAEHPLHTDTAELPPDEPTHTEPLVPPATPHPLLTCTEPPLDDALDPADTRTSPPPLPSLPLLAAACSTTRPPSLDAP